MGVKLTLAARSSEVHLVAIALATTHVHSKSRTRGNSTNGDRRALIMERARHFPFLEEELGVSKQRSSETEDAERLGTPRLF